MTVVGGISTHVSSYAISKDDFRNALKECFIYLEKRNDKSIIILHENYFGETVEAKQWINKFVNKYNKKGEKLTINSIN